MNVVWHDHVFFDGYTATIRTSILDDHIGYYAYVRKSKCRRDVGIPPYYELSKERFTILYIV